MLEAEAKKRLINWVHRPIGDMDIPKNDTLYGLNKIRPQLLEAINRDLSIAIHCMGGLGRSGTIAAIILADLGIPLQSAIDRVRQFRPGAIETKAQENFVRRMYLGTLPSVLMCREFIKAFGLHPLVIFIWAC